MPFIVCILSRLPRWAAVSLVAVLVLGSDFLDKHVVGTAAYLGMFGLGSLLALGAREEGKKIPGWAWGGILLLGLMLYSVMSWRYVLPSIWMGYYSCAIGSTLIIACVAWWPPIRDPLHNLYSRIGVDLSYGVYILHYPVLVFLQKEGCSSLAANPWAAFAASYALTFLLAWTLNRKLETPAIQLGRRLAKRIEGRA